MTTSYCAAAYLKSKNFQKKVYVLGSTGITQELDKAHIQHLPVGVSTFLIVIFNDFGRKFLMSSIVTI